VLRFVREDSCHVSQAQDFLTYMDDPKVELLLLRAGLGSEKMTYLNRVIPTHTVLPIPEDLPEGVAYVSDDERSKNSALEDVGDCWLLRC
jgi:hypothetical protein